MPCSAAPPRPGRSFPLDARLGGVHDALARADGDPDGRLATSGILETEYLFASGRSRLSYTLDAATYSAPGDWHTVRHDLGGIYRAKVGGSGALRLFLGGTATWQANGDAWSMAGYRALGGMANVEHRPSEGPTLRVGYGLDGRWFPDLPELDQVEHGAFASAVFNLETRTTLIGEVHLGAKGYANGAPTSRQTHGGSSRGRGGWDRWRALR